MAGDMLYRKLGCCYNQDIGKGCYSIEQNFYASSFTTLNVDLRKYEIHKYVIQYMRHDIVINEHFITKMD